MATKIEWTNETWNPVIGCEKISEGCKNCYAERMAYRLACMEVSDRKPFNYANVSGNGTNRGWNGKTHLVKQALAKPLIWKKPRMIFVCSMGDLFHETVSFEWIDEVMEVIAMSNHTFQILTKHPKRMYDYFASERAWMSIVDNFPLKNLWIGVTAENKKTANERIPVLLYIPAAVRFVSCEPLLSNIELDNGFDYENEIAINFLTGEFWTSPRDEMGSKGPKLDWVIAGPETGPGARPMQKEWIENIYNQCQVAKVPFFDKKDTLGLNIKQMPNATIH